MLMPRWVRWALTAAVTPLLVFLVSPILVVVGSSFTSTSFLAFPPQGLSLKWYQTSLSNPKYLEAFKLSFILALLSAVAAAVLGTSGALALTRSRFRGQALLSSFFMSPLVLPQVVIGVSILQLFGFFGLERSFIALLAGHCVVTVPYVIRTVQSTLVGYDASLDEASLDLGASRWRTFWHVTLPLIKSGVIAGALFAFVVSWINVEISLFLSSSVGAPIPIQIFNYVQYNVDPSIAAISALSVYVAFLLLLTIDKLVGLDSIATF